MNEEYLMILEQADYLEEYLSYFKCEEIDGKRYYVGDVGGDVRSMREDRYQALKNYLAELRTKILYEENEDFRRYVDRYSRQYRIEPEEAIRHRIVISYAEYVVGGNP
jgi:hypothetical protein